jgi:hypothetical protein
MVLSLMFAMILSLSLLLSFSQAADDTVSNPRLRKYLDFLVSIDHCPYNIGFLLEELVRLELRETWNPEEYEITGGLELYAPTGFSLGEIDILVMRKSDSKVMMIGEAKMWRDLEKGLEKAKSQLARLKNTIEEKKWSRLYFKPDPKRVLDASIFDNNIQYLTFSSKGGVAVGFNQEVNISTSEGRILADLCIARHYEKVDYASNPRYGKYLELIRQFKKIPNDDRVLFTVITQANLMVDFNPQDYMISEELAYFDSEDRELGHVKLAVQSRKTGKIIWVSDLVYGWNDPVQGLKVYNNYLSQFDELRTSGKIARFAAARPKDYTLPADAADGTIVKEVIGPIGTKALGFSREIDVDEDVIFWLRCKAENRF